MCIPGVLKRLFGEFVSGEMVSFAVSGGGGAMSVRRKVMKFCSSIMRALRHRVLLNNLDAAKVEVGQGLSIVDVPRCRVKRLRSSSTRISSVVGTSV